MINQSLISKETNFFELNKELEEKVKSLMVEVDSIINKQQDVIRTPKNSSNTLLKKSKIKSAEIVSEINIDTKEEKEEEEEGESYSSLENLSKNIHSTDKNIDFEFDNDDADKDESRKKKKKRSTNETIIRFLKAQVIKLQAEIQAAQHELKKKDECCKELEIEIKKHEEKREKIHKQLSSYKETILKAEASHSELQSKIQSQNTEIASLKKEVESLKKDLRSLNHLSSNSDLRLNRSLEENEKLRSSLKISQNEEKELREQIRKIQEEKRLALKNFEKQRTDIFQAFKKQTQLVDNLKKQKAYLEACKEIHFIEEDFTKLLEWKPDKI